MLLVDKNDMLELAKSFGIDADTLEKAQRNMANLHKEVITDKNGHKKTVYKRNMVEEAKGRTKKPEEDSGKQQPKLTPDIIKIRDAINDIEDQIRKTPDSDKEKLNELAKQRQEVQQKGIKASYFNKKTGAESSESESTKKPAAGMTKESVENVKKYSVGQYVEFAYGGNTLKGEIVAQGGDGVTIKTPEDGRVQVKYQNLGATVKNSDGTIPPEKFNAQDYKKSVTDPEVTNDEAGATHVYDLLKKDPDYTPELIDRITDSTKQRLDKLGNIIKSQGDTEMRYKTANGEYSEERKKLHKEIIDDILSDEKVKAAKPKNGEKPKFIIFGGRGGSGKSWFTDKEKAKKAGREVMFDEDNFIKLDADAIKERLIPPYKGWNAGEVHEESSYLMKQIKAIAKEKGLNIILDGTMNYNPNKPNKVRDEVQGFKDAGYSTEAHYMFLPIQESCKRAVMRYANSKKGYDMSGRLVPMDVLTGMQDNELSFDSVKDIVDNWSFRDNNVNRGEEPKLISQKTKK